MIKVGLIGVGGMGSSHLDNWKMMDGVKVVAICDIRFDLAREKSNGEAFYTDINEMLEKEDLDILDVCTPTYLHKDHAINAMNRGINVLTEKPCALKEEDAAEMYACAQKNGVKFMVAHVIRFVKDYIILKEINQSKKYGKLLQGRFWRLSSTPKWSYDNWMLDEEKSGFVPFDLHIHDCDFIYSMLGKPKKVTAVRAVNKYSGYSDHYIAQYDYTDATVFAESAWFNCKDYPFNAGFEITFEKAVVRLNHDGFKAYPSDGACEDLSSAKIPEDTGINLTSTDGYFEEMHYFKECVKNDEQPDIIKSEEVIGVLNIIKNGINYAKLSKNL